MRIPKNSGKRRLILALAGGILSSGAYKLYLYINDREQFEDSNLLVSLVQIFVATVLIFLILKLFSISKHPQQ